MNNNTECIATPAPGRLCVVISAVLWALKSLCGGAGPRPISIRAAAFSYQQRLRFVPLVILFQTDMGDLMAVIPALVRSGNLQTRRLLNLNFALRFSCWTRGISQSPGLPSLVFLPGCPHGDCMV